MKRILALVLVLVMVLANGVAVASDFSRFADELMLEYGSIFDDFGDTFYTVCDDGDFWITITSNLSSDDILLTMKLYPSVGDNLLASYHTLGLDTASAFKTLFERGGFSNTNVGAMVVSADGSTLVIAWDDAVIFEWASSHTTMLKKGM